MGRRLRIGVSGLLCLLLVAALAYLPGPVRRLPLRSLIIATTLVAVVLGLAVWAGR